MVLFLFLSWLLVPYLRNGQVTVRKDRAGVEIKKYKGDGKQHTTNDIPIPSHLYSSFLQNSMIPRFANPHAVLEKTQIVSREELSGEGGEGEYSEPDLSRVEEFNEVMKRTFAPFRLEEGGKKRRKVQVEEEESGTAAISIRMSDVAVLQSGTNGMPVFRLVSNGPPMLISLQPKPEPHLKWVVPRGSGMSSSDAILGFESRKLKTMKHKHRNGGSKHLQSQWMQSGSRKSL